MHLDSLGVLVSNPIRPGRGRGGGHRLGAGHPAVEPERIVYAIGGVAGYVQGFRDGVDDLAERVLGLGGALSAAGGELTRR